MNLELKWHKTHPDEPTWNGYWNIEDEKGYEVAVCFGAPKAELIADRIVEDHNRSLSKQAESSEVHLYQPAIYRTVEEALYTTEGRAVAEPFGVGFLCVWSEDRIHLSFRDRTRKAAIATRDQVDLSNPPTDLTDERFIG